MPAARLFVVIATVGRAQLAGQVVALLTQQTRPPDAIVVVGVDEADVAGLAPPVEVLRCEKGLPRQRNRALAHIGTRADLVVFFDDDFVPRPDYLAQVEALFARDPGLVGITGRLIADGIAGTGIPFEDALALVAADQPPPAEEQPRRGLYGCNMAIRLSAARGIWFDENLPLYGWQEDIDFTYQVGQRGRMIRSSLPAGVHMGAKGGRTSGTRLGYSQVANPLYLLGKRTIPPRLAWRIMTRNIASNLVRSLRPEAHIDRAGRLRGNAIALGHLLTGRLHPTRILKL